MRKKPLLFFLLTLWLLTNCTTPSEVEPPQIELTVERPTATTTPQPSNTAVSKTRATASPSPTPRLYASPTPTPTKEPASPSGPPPPNLSPLPPVAGTIPAPTSLIFLDNDFTSWRINEQGMPTEISPNPYTTYNSQQTYAVSRAIPGDGMFPPRLVVTDLSNNAYTLFDLDEGTDISFITTINDAAWLDEAHLVTGVYNDDGDFASIKGHPTIVNILTGKFTIIDDEQWMHSDPVVQNGRIHYTTDTPRQLTIWQDGAFLPWQLPDTVLEQLPQDGQLLTPAIAPNGAEAWWIRSETEGKSHFYIYDPHSGLLQKELPTNLYNPSFLPQAPYWNDAGTWVVVPLWALSSKAPTLWLFAADGSQQFELGPNSHTPLWIGPDTLAYLADSNGTTAIRAFSPTHSTHYEFDIGNHVPTDLLHIADEITITPDTKAVSTPLTSLNQFPVNQHPRYPDNWQGQSYTAPAINPPTPDNNDVWIELSNNAPNGRYTTQAWSLLPTEVTPDQHAQLFTLTDDSQTYALIETFEPWGIGVGYYDILHWTEETLYFTYRPIPGGCSLHTNSSDLWQYTFATQQVSQRLPSLTLTSALSPDATQWAITHRDHLQLIDLTTDTGTNYQLPDNGQTIAQLSWSPDGQYLLFTSESEGCGSPTTTQQIHTIDWENNTITTLATLDSWPLQILGWRDHKTAVLQPIHQTTKHIITIPQ